MFGRRFKIATGVVITALVLVVGMGSGAALAQTPPWQKALNIRSSALDKKYRLDTMAIDIARRYHLVSTRTTASAGAPDWLRALIVRSDALDREYGLGAYAKTGK